MPVGVQCPISSSLDEFPSYWDWLWCPGLSPVSVSIALPFAFHTWCFPFALVYHWISIVFLLYGRRIATHSVDPSLTHFLGEFPGLGLALVPDVEVPEADSGAHGAENSIQISALAGVEPRTLASSGILASSKRALMKLNSPVINGRRGHPAQNTGNSS